MFADHFRAGTVPVFMYFIFYLYALIQAVVGSGLYIRKKRQQFFCGFNINTLKNLFRIIINKPARVYIRINIVNG